MNKTLKLAIKAGFEAPEPVGKKNFLSRLNAPKSTYRDFFFSQINYIRKRVWCFSAVVALVLVSLALWSNADSMIWISIALTPFLALLTVTELSRSSVYNMEELELSCRYRLPQIVIARAAILGSSNLLLLLIMGLAVGIWTEYPILSAVFYVFAPYLLTCVLSIFILNRMCGNEGIYCCAAIACVVSGSDSVLRVIGQYLFTEQYLWGWGLLCMFSLFLLMKQGNKYIRTMEEYQWNLLSTD